MASKIHLGSYVKVRQTISLKRTIKLASLGASSAGLLCLLLFFTFNSRTENVTAGTQSVKSDTSKFAIKALFDVSDSMVKYQGKVAATDSIYSLREQQSLSKKQKKAAKTRKDDESKVLAFEDFINIYPKNTTGSFNVSFQLPGKENLTSRIEILDLTGKIIDTKIATPENGNVLEKFDMNKDLPDGPYLIKIYMNKALFVRQVVLQKELM